MQFTVSVGLNILERFLNTGVIFTSLAIVVAFLDGFHFSEHRRIIQWRHRSSTSARVSNGAVQPPLHRTPQAVAVSECVGSFECYEVVSSAWSEKIWLGRIFGSVVTFSDQW